MKTDTHLALLPATVKIGPHTWKIRVTENTGDVPEGKAPNFGMTLYMAQEILIHPKLADSATAVGVLLHEIYHAALFSLGFKQPKKEEDAACYHEAMMTTVFRDNIWLLDWIKRGLK